MIIDVYEDIAKKFFSKSVDLGTISEIKGFLKGKFPNLKRITDPRKISLQDQIIYEENGIHYHFENTDDAVIMQTGTAMVRSTLIRFLPQKIEGWFVGVNGDMFEEIYEYSTTNGKDGRVAAQATINYYDQKATDLLLQGRKATEFAYESEKDNLSLLPDATFQAYATPLTNIEGTKKWVEVGNSETNEKIAEFEGAMSSFEALAKSSLEDRCLMNLEKGISR